MPSERGEEPWVDEMDGPERLARAKKRRAEQLERWERRENTTGNEGKKRRKTDKTLKFKPNIVILEAAARNDLEEVAELLENGVSPDLANEDGLTALHQSCIDGCDDMVKYLIEHNANVNACDKESWNPLHAAVACGHMSIIQYLMENGGDILALNLDGNFPVDLVDNNDEVEKYLDQQLSKLGYNDESIEELRQNQGKQLLDDLKDSVENGRSLDVQDENGATAFHVAAAQGWTIVVDYLLENEADFEIRDNDGWQPIHAAAAWGQDTVLEILVASGADLDSRTNNSETPLDLSEEDEITELIEELKTNQVKYPRRGKVRRRRSNASNSSIKRSSIHEKNELSHTDTKAEGAALLIQLQNTDDSEANSPDEPASSPQILETHLSERVSNSSKEETSSSGYHSEGSTKSEEKMELSKNKKTTDEAKDKPTRNSGDYNAEKERSEKPIENKNEITEKEEKKSSGNKSSTNNIKQSPVPKPPRLMTGSAPREAKAYINLEIEHSETAKVKKPKDDETKKNPDSENIKPSAENSANKTNEINKIADSANATKQTATANKNATSLLPRLTPSDKRKAPEPPVAPKHTESKQPPAKESQKDSTLEKKKANRPGKRNSDSSNKKSCTIL